MPTADRGSTAIRLLMLIALYAIPAVVTLRPIGDPIFDPDIWWHLRTGQWIAANGTVPDLDPFSQASKPWIAYSWLYEVLVYELFAAIGLAGIVLFRVAMALGIAAALHHLVARREPRFLVATGLTALALLAIAMLFSERPWLFTILFGTLTLTAILDMREGRPGALPWLLPAMFGLWANVHIQFVYGLGLLGLACATPWIDRWLGVVRWDDTAATAGSAAWRRLAWLTVACLFASLLNPFHVRIYQVVLEYATQPGPFRFVNELKALEFREPSDWVTLGLAAAATFALGRRARLGSFDVLLLTVAAIFAFRARRDLWLLVIVSVAILTPRRNAPDASERFAITPGRLAIVAVGIVLVAALTIWRRELSAEKLQKTVAKVFPVGAAKCVAERNYTGPLYNDFNWGGYLIWAVPHLPVAIDGRTNLHGDDRIQQWGSTWAGNRGWREDRDLAAAGVVIAPADSPLAGLLAADARFAVVYNDGLAMVFLAKSKTVTVRPMPRRPRQGPHPSRTRKRRTNRTSEPDA